jgi:hypothetical protein
MLGLGMILGATRETSMKKQIKKLVLAKERSRRCFRKWKAGLRP